jgi:tetratricopeptide (TPR) repeat protein
MFLAAWAVMAQQTATPPPLVPLDQLKVPKAEEGFSDADQPQAASLGGNALFGAKDKDGKIAAGIQLVKDKPNDPEAWLALGRLQDMYLRYLESIASYSEGVARFPKDFRFLRMRGHRYLSVRRFREAISDLDTAAKLAPDSFEVAYYRGLAYYFNGDHAKAAEVFAACEAQVIKPLETKTDLKGGRSCEVIGKDLNALVPLVYWHYMALRRAGEMDAAKKYLAANLPEAGGSNATVPYYDSLLFFTGKKEIGDMLAGANDGGREYLTRSTAVALYLFTEGERAQACGMWSRNAMNQSWDHLGVINAESELFLNSKAACSLYSVAAPPKAQ